jgi:hydroxypyruvate reductase
VLDLGELQGEARRLGAEHARLVRDLAADHALRARPLLILSGGETSVAVSGHGQGGRNTEYLLSLALGLGGTPGVYALAADTDGLDGKGGHAGALLRPESPALWAAAGLDARACLAANDSRAPFAASHDLLTTGPTRTNVNDLRLLLLTPDRS